MPTRQKKYVSPVKNEKNLRRPGQKLEEDLYDIIGEKIMPYFTLIIAFGVITFLEWIRYLLKLPLSPYFDTVIFIVITMFSIFKIIKFIKMGKLIKQGLDGERFIAGVLDSFKEKGCKVFDRISTKCRLHM